MSGSWASLAASLVLLLAAIGGGAGILRLLDARPGTGERLLYALVLGLGLQGTLLLGASALGWMHPAVLWACVLLPALFGRGTTALLQEVGQRMQASLLTLTSAERFALLIVGSGVAMILFVGAAVPVTDWDSDRAWR